MKVYSYDSALLELAEPFEVDQGATINAIMVEHDEVFQMDPDRNGYDIDHCLRTDKESGEEVFVLMMADGGWRADLFFCSTDDEAAKRVCRSWFNDPEYMTKFTGGSSKSGF